jgi:hypothetical protein
LMNKIVWILQTDFNHLYAVRDLLSGQESPRENLISRFLIEAKECSIFG